MKIRKNRRREWARLLLRGASLIIVTMVFFIFIKARRIVGNELAPKYMDGDLVLLFKPRNTPFLQLRVRGFDD